MKKFLSMAIWISFTAFTTSAHASGILSAELPDLVEKILPGVVNISTVKVQRTTVYGMDEYFRAYGVPQEQQSQSMGSGFIISKDGFVLTNNHVIDGADEVLVTLLNKKTYKARIVGTDPKLDLALIRIRDDGDKSPPDLSPLTLGNSDVVRIAEPVFAVGNPFGLQHTVTTGIISAKNRTIGLGPLDNFLQTDASINPGNSGGPLFNFKGEVIGMNTSIFSKTGQSAGLGFSIPINEAKKVIEDLKKFGRVPRPWIGILGQSVSPRLQAYYNLPVSEGVLIVNLVTGAPGITSGLTRGDIVIQVDGDKVSENADIEREIYRKKPKETVTMKVRRGKKTLDLKVKLDELPKLDVARLPQGLI